MPCSIFSLIHLLISLAQRSGIEYVGKVPKSAPGLSRISWFIFLSGGSPSGITSGNTSGCWSIMSSVVSTAALVTGTGYWFGFEYRLILSMFYVWFRVSFDTQYVLCLVSSIV